VATSLSLRVATYLLVADGIAALHLGGLLGGVAAALVATAAAASWSPPAAIARAAAARRLGAALAVLATAASLLDLLYVSQSVLDALARLLLFLLVYRLFTRRTLRDSRDIAFLSFFMLVVVSPATSGVGFLLVFVVFLVVGTWTLMLYHVLSEAERASVPAGANPTAGLGRDLLALSVAASAATVVITAGLFFVIPRVGQAALPLRAHLGRMVSGFSERVELGAFGEIETDPTVIMRVGFPGTTLAPELLDLRWRGVALDRFDGRAWSVGRPERVTLRRPSASGTSQFLLGTYRGAGPIVSQDIYLEPMGTDVVFVAPRALYVGLRADVVVVDDMGSVSVPTAAARLHYTVISELEADPRRSAAVGGSRPVDPASFERYLQLPELPPRVGALARQVTEGSPSPREAARRLTEFLARNFRYTLVLDKGASRDPVDEFLFVQRAGNCEYFAAALAVMLRSLGIPARVVSGFQRGEWNPYGQYFMVRLRDAHSWVEAYTEGGWTTLDPSPRGEAAGRGLASLYLDALRMRWYRYVVNWSIQDQVFAASRVRQAAASLGAWRLDEPAGTAARAAVVAGIVLAGGVASLVAWRRVQPARTRQPVARVPRFYARALRALARRGLTPRVGETAREFAGRVRACEPASADLIDGVTGAYERVRFGALAPADVEVVEAWVASLERAPRREVSAI
jgi:transglutaminase-like putative cysteine protease